MAGAWGQIPLAVHEAPQELPPFPSANGWRLTGDLTENGTNDSQSPSNWWLPCSLVAGSELKPHIFLFADLVLCWEDYFVDSKQLFVETDPLRKWKGNRPR